MIPIYEPSIDKYTCSAIKAINSGWISNHGEYVEKATSTLNNKLNLNFTILMANGTCATHCLFLSLKYKHPSINKLYVPNNCYVAAWNMAIAVYNNEQIEVMKMNINTWNINTDEEYIMGLDRNSAMLIVHNLGNIINIKRLKQLRPDIIYLEDNCEGFTGKYNNVYTGSSEDTLCSSISFYGNKIMTTGEGGAFITSDKLVYDYILKVYSQGMSNERYIHETHAYNYRMTNIQAAFLYDQLNDFDAIVKNKQTIFKNYKTLLEPLIYLNQVKLFQEEEHTESACWIFGVRLVNNKIPIKDLILYFKNYGIDIRPFFYTINVHNHLKQILYKNDEIADILSNEIIMLPSSPTIKFEEQKYIIKTVEQLLNFSTK